MSETVGIPSKDYKKPAELSQLTYLEQNLFSEVISSLVELQPHREQRFLTFQEIAEYVGCRNQTISNINSEAGLSALSKSDPDLVLSIRFGSILREAAIAIPRLGVLNLHSGLLPRYKGILTTLHSLLDGQPEVGCTLHKIDSPSIDAGPIVDTARVSVDKDRSLLWHVFQIYPLGCQMIIDAVSMLAAGQSLRYLEQDNIGQPYFSLPTSEDFQKLRDRGFRVWDSEDLAPIYDRYFAEPYRKTMRTS
jgi:methionyl-tRNA formyltransferase